MGQATTAAASAISVAAAALEDANNKIDALRDRVAEWESMAQERARLDRIDAEVRAKVQAEWREWMVKANETERALRARVAELIVVIQRMGETIEAYGAINNRNECLEREVAMLKAALAEERGWLETAERQP